MIRCLLPLLLLSGCFWKEGSTDVEAWVWVDEAGELKSGEAVATGTTVMVCASSERRTNSSIPVPAPGAQGETLGARIPAEKVEITASAGTVGPATGFGDTSGCRDILLDQPGSVDIVVAGTIDGARSIDTATITVADATTTLSWITDGPVLLNERVPYRALVKSTSGANIVAVPTTDFPGGERIVGGSALAEVLAAGTQIRLASLPPRPVQARPDSLRAAAPQPTDGGFEFRVEPLVGERVADVFGTHSVTVNTPRVCSTLRTPRAGEVEEDVEHREPIFVRKVENAEDGPCQLSIASTYGAETVSWDAEIALP